MDIFSKLTADELAAVKVPLANVLSNLAAGDGSTASIVGQGVVLQGLLITLAPQIQKIGVSDLATAALAYLNTLGTAGAGNILQSGAVPNA